MMRNHVTCPECGAEVSTEIDRCWLCDRAQDTSAADERNHAPTIEPHQPQFGITSLMLTITLIAVVLGVLRLVPGLGIALVVFVTPAFVRATVLAAREKAAGRRLGTGKKAVAFLASLGLVVSLVMAAGAAFYVTCWGGFFVGAVVSEAAGARGWNPLGWGLWTGVVVGIVGQIIFTALFVRWLWKRRKEQRNRLGDIGFIVSWVGFATVYTIAIFEITVPRIHIAELTPLGLIALPGLILSLIALRKPRRSLASCGVGLGTSALGVTIVFVIANASGMLFSRRGPDTSFAVALVLLFGLVAAVAISFVIYYLSCWREQQTEKK